MSLQLECEMVKEQQITWFISLSFRY